MHGAAAQRSQVVPDVRAGPSVPLPESDAVFVCCVCACVCVGTVGVCVCVWVSTRVPGAVAPMYAPGDNTVHAQLAACVRAVLDAAVDSGLPRVALCGLGAGVFGWPQPAAARLIVHGLREWVSARGGAAAAPSVILYDSAPSMAAAFRDALVAAEAGVGAASVPAAVAPAPPAPPVRATHQWQRQDGAPGVVEADKWAPYDYDQNRQLEQAWALDPAGKATLVGDAFGARCVTTLASVRA